MGKSREVMESGAEGKSLYYRHHFSVNLKLF